MIDVDAPTCFFRPSCEFHFKWKICQFSFNITNFRIVLINVPVSNYKRKIRKNIQNRRWRTLEKHANSIISSKTQVRLYKLHSGSNLFKHLEDHHQPSISSSPCHHKTVDFSTLLLLSPQAFLSSNMELPNSNQCSYATNFFVSFIRPNPFDF